MLRIIHKKRFGVPFRCVVVGMVIIFTMTMPLSGLAQILPAMPVPGAMVPLSPSAYAPPLLMGVELDLQNPLQMDFLIDQGEDVLAKKAQTEEYGKLLKYFLAALTIPDDHLWVNLSPYEKDRIIADDLAQTQMGMDLLAQDYLLKQLTSTLMYPEDDLGEEFWERIYQKAYEEYGVTDIPVNTFNKVWIVPEKAIVYEEGSTAWVVESRLKVMLEEDYLFREGADRRGLIHQTQDKGMINHAPTNSNITTSIIREILLPEIEREVNEGQHFAPLRQIVHAMILATWYKRTLKDGLLGQAYVNQSKTAGVDKSEDINKEKIYQQYLEAFQKGVYDYIREEYDAATETIIPRKYFAGGFEFENQIDQAYQKITNFAQLSFEDQAMVAVNYQAINERGLVRAESVLKNFERDIVKTDDAMLEQVKTPEESIVGYYALKQEMLMALDQNNLEAFEAAQERRIGVVEPLSQAVKKMSDDNLLRLIKEDVIDRKIADPLLVGMHIPGKGVGLDMNVLKEELRRVGQKEHLFKTQQHIDTIQKEMASALSDNPAEEKAIMKMLDETIKPYNFDSYLPEHFWRESFKDLEGRKKIAAAIVQMPVAFGQSKGAFAPDTGNVLISPIEDELMMRLVLPHEIGHKILKMPPEWEQITFAISVMEYVQHAGKNLKEGEEKLPHDVDKFGEPAVSELYQRGKEMGLSGQTGFMIHPGTSDRRAGYFVMDYLEMEVEKVYEAKGLRKDALNDEYTRKRAMGFLVGGIMMGMSENQKDVNPLRLFKDFLDVLYERYGDPTKDNPQLASELEKIDQEWQEYAKRLAAKQEVEFIPAPYGFWTYKSLDSSVGQMHYVKTDRYPRTYDGENKDDLKGKLQAARDRTLGQVFLAISRVKFGLRGLIDDLNEDIKKHPDALLMWDTLLFPKVSGIGHDVNAENIKHRAFEQKFDGSRKWMSRILQDRYDIGNPLIEEAQYNTYDLHLRYLDSLLYLRYHYKENQQGNMKDPRNKNPQVEDALVRSMGKDVNDDGWIKLMYRPESLKQGDIIRIINEKVGPVYLELYAEAFKEKKRRRLHERKKKEEQDRREEQLKQGIKEIAKEIVRKVYEELTEEERKELDEYGKNLPQEIQKVIEDAVREDMEQGKKSFENLSQPGGGSGSSQKTSAASSGQGSSQGSGQGQVSPGATPKSTDDIENALKDFEQQLNAIASNTNTIAKKLDDIKKKSGDVTPGKMSESDKNTSKKLSKEIQQQAKGIQDKSQDLLNKGRLAAGEGSAQNEKVSQIQQGLPSPELANEAKKLSNGVDKKSQEQLEKLQNLKDKANKLKHIADNLVKQTHAPSPDVPQITDETEKLNKALNNVNKGVDQTQGANRDVLRNLHQLEKSIQGIQQSLSGSKDKGEPGKKENKKGEDNKNNKGGEDGQGKQETSSSQASQDMNKSSGSKSEPAKAGETQKGAKDRSKNYQKMPDTINLPDVKPLGETGKKQEALPPSDIKPIKPKEFDLKAAKLREEAQIEATSGLDKTQHRELQTWYKKQISEGRTLQVEHFRDLDIDGEELIEKMEIEGFLENHQISKNFNEKEFREKFSEYDDKNKTLNKILSIINILKRKPVVTIRTLVKRLTRQFKALLIATTGFKLSQLLDNGAIMTQPLNVFLGAQGYNNPIKKDPLPLDITLLVDRSYSMGEKDRKNSNYLPIEMARIISFVLTDSIFQHYEMRKVIVDDDLGYEVGYFSDDDKDLQLLRETIREPNVKREKVLHGAWTNLEAGGGTHYADNLEKYITSQIAAAERSEKKGVQILFILTDEDVDPNQKSRILGLINKAREHGINVFIIPMGTAKQVEDTKVLHQQPKGQLQRVIEPFPFTGLPSRVGDAIFTAIEKSGFVSDSDWQKYLQLKDASMVVEDSELNTTEEYRHFFNKKVNGQEKLMFQREGVDPLYFPMGPGGMGVPTTVIKDTEANEDKIINILLATHRPDQRSPTDYSTDGKYFIHGIEDGKLEVMEENKEDGYLKFLHAFDSADHMVENQGVYENTQKLQVKLEQSSEKVLLSQENGDFQGLGDLKGLDLTQWYFYEQDSNRILAFNRQEKRVLIIEREKSSWQVLYDLTVSQDSMSDSWEGQTVTLSGGPGLAKTKMPSAAARLINMPTYSETGNEDATDEGLARGTRTLQNGTTGFKPSLLNYVKHVGGWIIENERHKYEPGVWDGIKSHIPAKTHEWKVERDGMVTFETMRDHPMSRIITTENPPWPNITGNWTTNNTAMQERDENILYHWQSTEEEAEWQLADALKFARHVGTYDDRWEEFEQKITQDITDLVRISNELRLTFFGYSPEQQAAIFEDWELLDPRYLATQMRWDSKIRDLFENGPDNSKGERLTRAPDPRLTAFMIQHLIKYEKDWLYRPFTTIKNYFNFHAEIDSNDTYAGNITHFSSWRPDELNVPDLELTKDSFKLSPSGKEIIITPKNTEFWDEIRLPIHSKASFHYAGLPQEIIDWIEFADVAKDVNEVNTYLKANVGKLYLTLQLQALKIKVHFVGGPGGGKSTLAKAIVRLRNKPGEHTIEMTAQTRLDQITFQEGMVGGNSKITINALPLAMEDEHGEGNVLIVEEIAQSRDKVLSALNDVIVYDETPDPTKKDKKRKGADNFGLIALSNTPGSTSGIKGLPADLLARLPAIQFDPLPPHLMFKLLSKVSTKQLDSTGEVVRLNPRLIGMPIPKSEQEVSDVEYETYPDGSVKYDGIIGMAQELNYRQSLDGTTLPKRREISVRVLVKDVKFLVDRFNYLRADGLQKIAKTGTEKSESFKKRAKTKISERIIHEQFMKAFKIEGDFDQTSPVENNILDVAGEKGLFSDDPDVDAISDFLDKESVIIQNLKIEEGKEPDTGHPELDRILQLLWTNTFESQTEQNIENLNEIIAELLSEKSWKELKKFEEQRSRMIMMKKVMDQIDFILNYRSKGETWEQHKEGNKNRMNATKDLIKNLGIQRDWSAAFFDQTMKEIEDSYDPEFTKGLDELDFSMLSIGELIWWIDFQKNDEEAVSKLKKELREKITDLKKDKLEPLEKVQILLSRKTHKDLFKDIFEHVEKKIQELKQSRPVDIERTLKDYEKVESEVKKELIKIRKPSKGVGNIEGLKKELVKEQHISDITLETGVALPDRTREKELEAEIKELELQVQGPNKQEELLTKKLIAVVNGKQALIKEIAAEAEEAKAVEAQKAEALQQGAVDTEGIINYEPLPGEEVIGFLWNGRKVVTQEKEIGASSASRNVRIRDMKNIELVTWNRGHRFDAKVVGVSDDETKILTKDDNGKFVWWDLKGEDESIDLGNYPFAKLLPDGNHVFRTTNSGRYDLFDTIDTTSPTSSSLPNDPMLHPDISPDGTKVIATDEEGMVRVKDIKSGYRFGLETGLKIQVQPTISPDNKRMVILDKDGGVSKLWDVEKEKRVLDLEKNTKAALEPVFSRDSTRVATVSKMGVVRVWDAEKGALIKATKQHKKGVKAVALSHDGRYLAVVDGEGKYWLQDLEKKGNERTELPALDALQKLEKDEVPELEFSRDGEHHVKAHVKGGLNVWPVADFMSSAPAFKPKDAEEVHSYSEDGLRVLTVEKEYAYTKMVKHYRWHVRYVKGGKELRVFEWPKAYVELSPGGTKVLMQHHRDGEIIDVKTGEKISSENVYDRVSHKWLIDDAHPEAGAGQDKNTVQGDIKVLPAKDMKVIQTYTAPDGEEIMQVAWEMDGNGDVPVKRRVVLTEAEADDPNSKVMRVRDIEQEESVDPLREDTVSKEEKSKISKDGNRFLFATPDGVFRENLEGEPRGGVRYEFGKIEQFEDSSDSNKVVVIAENFKGIAYLDGRSKETQEFKVNGEELEGEVESIDISPDSDSSKALVLTKSKALYLFNMETGEGFMLQGDSVSFAKFSRDGQFILTGSEDGRVSIKSPHTGALKIEGLQVSDAVQDIELSFNKKELIVATKGFKARYEWKPDARKWDPLSSVVVEESKFLPDGQIMTAGVLDKGKPALGVISGNGPVHRINDLGKLKNVENMQVKGLNISPDNLEQATTWQEGDQTKHVLIHEIAKDVGGGSAFSGSDLSDKIEAFKKEKKKWAAQKAKYLKQEQSFDEQLALEKKNAELAAANDLKNKVGSGKIVLEALDVYTAPPGETIVDYSPQSGLVLTEDNIVRANGKNHWIVRDVRKGGDEVNSFDLLVTNSAHLSPDGTKVAKEVWKDKPSQRKIELWEVRKIDKGKPLATSKEGEFDDFSFSEDGSRIIMEKNTKDHNDKKTIVWNWAIDDESDLLSLGNAGISVVSKLSDNNRWLFMSLKGKIGIGTLAFRNMDTKSEIQQEHSVSFAKFSRGSKYLMFVQGKNVILRDLNTGINSPPILVSAAGEIVDLELSPNGKTLLTRNKEGKLHVWDVMTGERIMPASPAWINLSITLLNLGAVFLDNEHFFGIGKSNNIGIVNARTGEIYGKLMENKFSQREAKFFPHQNQAVIFNEDRTQLQPFVVRGGGGEVLNSGKKDAAMLSIRDLIGRIAMGQGKKSAVKDLKDQFFKQINKLKEDKLSSLEKVPPLLRNETYKDLFKDMLEHVEKKIQELKQPLSGVIDMTEDDYDGELAADRVELEKVDVMLGQRISGVSNDQEQLRNIIKEKEALIAKQEEKIKKLKEAIKAEEIKDASGNGLTLQNLKNSIKHEIELKEIFEGEINQLRDFLKKQVSSGMQKHERKHLEARRALLTERIDSRVQGKQALVNKKKVAQAKAELEPENAQTTQGSKDEILPVEKIKENIESWGISENESVVEFVELNYSGFWYVVTREDIENNGEKKVVWRVWGEMRNFEGQAMIEGTPKVEETLGQYDGFTLSKEGILMMATSEGVSYKYVNKEEDDWIKINKNLDLVRGIELKKVKKGILVMSKNFQGVVSLNGGKDIPLKDMQGNMKSIEISKDGKLAAFVMFDYNVYLINIENGERIYRSQYSNINFAKFSLDDEVVLIGKIGGGISFRDSHTGEETKDVFNLPGNDSIEYLERSLDKNKLIVKAKFGKITVWKKDAISGEWTLDENYSLENAIRAKFLPDSKHIMFFRDAPEGNATAGLYLTDGLRTYKMDAPLNSDLEILELADIQLIHGQLAQMEIYNHDGRGKYVTIRNIMSKNDTSDVSKVKVLPADQMKVKESYTAPEGEVIVQHAWVEDDTGPEPVTRRVVLTLNKLQVWKVRDIARKNENDENLLRPVMSTGTLQFSKDGKKLFDAEKNGKLFVSSSLIQDDWKEIRKNLGRIHKVEDALDGNKVVIIADNFQGIVHLDGQDEKEFKDALGEEPFAKGGLKVLNVKISSDSQYAAVLTNHDNSYKFDMNTGSHLQYHANVVFSKFTEDGQVSLRGTNNGFVLFEDAKTVDFEDVKTEEKFKSINAGNEPVQDLDVVWDGKIMHKVNVKMDGRWKLWKWDENIKDWIPEENYLHGNQKILPDGKTVMVGENILSGSKRTMPTIGTYEGKSDVGFVDYPFEEEYKKDKDEKREIIQDDIVFSPDNLEQAETYTENGEIKHVFIRQIAESTDDDAPPSDNNLPAQIKALEEEEKQRRLMEIELNARAKGIDAELVKIQKKVDREAPKESAEEETQGDANTLAKIKELEALKVQAAEQNEQDQPDGTPKLSPINPAYEAPPGETIVDYWPESERALTWKEIELADLNTQDIIKAYEWRVRDTKDNKELFPKFDTLEKNVVRLSPDGTKIALKSGSTTNHKVDVWSVEDDTKRTFVNSTEVTGFISSLSFSSDGKEIVIGSRKGPIGSQTEKSIVTTWHWEKSGSPKFSQISQEGKIRYKQLSSDNKTLLTLDESNTQRVWNMEAEIGIELTDFRREGIALARLSSDGNNVISIKKSKSDDGYPVWIRNINGAEPSRFGIWEEAKFTDLSPDEDTLLIIDENGKLVLRDAQTGEKIKQDSKAWEEFKHMVNKFGYFLPDNEHFLSIGSHTPSATTLIIMRNFKTGEVANWSYIKFNPEEIQFYPDRLQVMVRNKEGSKQQVFSVGKIESLNPNDLDQPVKIPEGKDKNFKKMLSLSKQLVQAIKERIGNVKVRAVVGNKPALVEELDQEKEEIDKKITNLEAGLRKLRGVQRRTRADYKKGVSEVDPELEKANKMLGIDESEEDVVDSNISNKDWLRKRILELEGLIAEQQRNVENFETKLAKIATSASLSEIERLEKLREGSRDTKRVFELERKKLEEELRKQDSAMLQKYEREYWEARKDFLTKKKESLVEGERALSKQEESEAAVQAEVDAQKAEGLQKGAIDRRMPVNYTPPEGEEVIAYLWKGRKVVTQEFIAGKPSAGNPNIMDKDTWKVHIRDVESNGELVLLDRLLYSKVRWIEISDDETKMLAGHDFGVMLWNFNDIESSIDLGADNPSQARFSSDSNQVIITYFSQAIEVYDITKKWSDSKLVPVNPILYPDIGAYESKKIVATDMEGGVSVWDVIIEQTVDKIKISLLQLAKLETGLKIEVQPRISPNNKWIVILDKDGGVSKLWDVNNERPLKELEKNTSANVGPVYSLDSTRVATVSKKDGIVRWWYAQTGDFKGEADPFEDGVKALALSSDGIYLAVVDGKGKYWLENMDTKQRIELPAPDALKNVDKDVVPKLEFSTEGPLRVMAHMKSGLTVWPVAKFMSTGQPRAVKVLAAKDMTVIQPYTAPDNEEIVQVAWLMDGSKKGAPPVKRRIVLTREDRQGKPPHWRVRDTAKGADEELLSFPAGVENVVVKLSGDGRILWIGGESSMQWVDVLPDDVGSRPLFTNAIQINPEKSFIVDAPDGEKSVIIADNFQGIVPVDESKEIKEFKVNGKRLEEKVESIDINSDSTKVVLLTEKGKQYLFDMTTGKGKFLSGNASFTRFTKDGEFILTGMESGFVNFHDKDGNVIDNKGFDSGNREVKNLELSQDGKMIIVTTSFNRTVWEDKVGDNDWKKIDILETADGQVAKFLPNSHHIINAGVRVGFIKGDGRGVEEVSNSVHTLIDNSFKKNTKIKAYDLEFSPDRLEAAEMYKDENGKVKYAHIRQIAEPLDGGDDVVDNDRPVKIEALKKETAQWMEIEDEWNQREKEIDGLLAQEKAAFEAKASNQKDAPNTQAGTLKIKELETKIKSKIKERDGYTLTVGELAVVTKKAMANKDIHDWTAELAALKAQGADPIELDKQLEVSKGVDDEISDLSKQWVQAMEERIEKRKTRVAAKDDLTESVKLDQEIATLDQAIATLSEDLRKRREASDSKVVDKENYNTQNQKTSVIDQETAETIVSIKVLKTIKDMVTGKTLDGGTVSIDTRSSMRTLILDSSIGVLKGQLPKDTIMDENIDEQIKILRTMLTDDSKLDKLLESKALKEVGASSVEKDARIAAVQKVLKSLEEKQRIMAEIEGIKKVLQENKDYFKAMPDDGSIKSKDARMEANSSIVDYEATLSRLEEKLKNVDNAMLNQKTKASLGGINLDPQGMDMQIQGQGLELNLDPAMLQQQMRDIQTGNFPGLVPVILNITPAQLPPALLQLTLSKK